MDNLKKKWQKPELIVIARSNPEEMVLAWCKGIGGDYYNSLVGGCAEQQIFQDNHWWCSDCRQGANS
jgi:hypothetical protein